MALADGEPLLDFVVLDDLSAPGLYTVAVTYPTVGDFTLEVTLAGEALFSGPVTVTGPMVRSVDQLTYAFPEARFEHSMVSFEDDLYVFGGAKADKTYLDSLLKFDLAMEADTLFWNYKRQVTVADLPDKEFNVELYVDTAALIAAGKLKEDCADLRFFTDAGDSLSYWVEPAGAPAGCGVVGAETAVWIKVPTGMDQFWLYYGNAAAPAVSDAAAVFGSMFEDFEYDVSPLEMGWSMDSETQDTCSAAGYNPGDASAFQTVDSVSLTGSRSLRANAASTMGGSISKAMDTMTKFTMKVFLYDTMCDGVHFASPDFSSCSVADNGKTLLASSGNGAGVYTPSSAEFYTTVYPWHASTSVRSKGWHSFTMRDDDVAFSITYDEGSATAEEVPLRAEGITTDLFQLFLRAAPVDSTGEGSTMFWDSMLVTEYDPAVTTSMAAETPVVYNTAMQFTPVGTVGAPSARQAHSAVVYDSAMYVFGGERAAYEYSDVWKYTFATDAWEFQAPANSFDALARYDHSAVVYDGKMYVYGGRSPQPLGDFWAYDFASKTWAEMPTSPGMVPRFGHGAGVGAGKMYVVGGYVAGVDGADGSLSDELWAFDFAAAAWTKLGPRSDNFDDAWAMDPDDAITFPMAVPGPLFAMNSVVTGSTEALYMVGGAGGDAMTEAVGQLWKFELASKTWTLMATDPALLGRFDAAAAVVKNDAYLLMYGGHAGGTFMGDAVWMFVGEAGFSP